MSTKASAVLLDASDNDLPRESADVEFVGRRLLDRGSLYVVDDELFVTAPIPEGEKRADETGYVSRFEWQVGHPATSRTASFVDPLGDSR